MAGFSGAPSILTATNFPDDEVLSFGTSQDAGILWSTDDPNANAWMFQLPTGGAVNVPVAIFGIGIDGVDLGLFNGITQPTVAVMDADRDSALLLDFSADDLARIRTLGSASSLTISTVSGNLILDPDGDVAINDETIIANAGIALDVQNTTDAASNQVGVFRAGNRAVPAAFDLGYLSYTADDANGAQQEVARLEWHIGTLTAGAYRGGLILYDAMAGALVPVFSTAGMGAGLQTLIDINRDANDIDFIVRGDDGIIFQTIAQSGAQQLLLTGGLVFQSSSATEIGIAVVNTALTVGSSGSLIAPYLSAATAIGTDALFGNVDGAIAILHDTTPGADTIEVRVNGAWISVGLAGVVMNSQIPYKQGMEQTWQHHPGQLYTWSGHSWIDEALCMVCGEPIDPDEHRGAMLYPNARLGLSESGHRKVHAGYAHLHLERETQFRELQQEVRDLRAQLDNKGLVYA